MSRFSNSRQTSYDCGMSIDTVPPRFSGGPLEDRKLGAIAKQVVAHGNSHGRCAGGASSLISRILTSSTLKCIFPAPGCEKSNELKNLHLSRSTASMRPAIPYPYEALSARFPEVARFIPSNSLKS